MSDLVRAVGYIRVSTDEQADRGHSIAEQETMIRDKAEANGWTLVGIFSDPGISGAVEDRPGLQRMLDSLHKTDVVIVSALDRLAREEFVFQKIVRLLDQADVRLESLTAHVDRTTASGRFSFRVEAAVAQFERERIRERVVVVLAGLARDGKPPGGPAPDGFVHAETDGIKTYEIDPVRSKVIERVFELAESGVPDSQIARTMNVEGYRTRGRKGRAPQPWTRRQVQNVVTNTSYAGIRTHKRGSTDAQEFEGNWPALVPPAKFKKIQEARADRDLGAGHHERGAGAPARRHLLQGLLKCGKCGNSMYCQTAAYRRKSDGGKRRWYACKGAMQCDGTCDNRLDAELVDNAVMDRLHDLLPDFESWIARIEDRNSDERDRMAELVTRAETEVQSQERVVEKHKRRYRTAVAEDNPKADLILEFFEEAEAELSGAEKRLQATQDALEATPSEAPHDALLDFAINLRDSIAGRIADEKSAADVNRVLVESFELFLAYPPGVGLPEGVGVRAGAIAIEPVLRKEVALALIQPHYPDTVPEPVVPMKWVEAVRNSANSQA